MVVKKILIVLVLFLLFLSVPVSAADSNPFELSFENIKTTNIIYVGNALQYTINIKSNLNESVNAEIVLSMNHKDWATAGKKTDFNIDSFGNTSYSIELTPPLGTSTDNYNPIIYVCVKNVGQCSSIILRLHVVDRLQLKLDAFESVLDTYEADENISIMFTLNNQGKSNIINYKFKVNFVKDDVVLVSELFDLDPIDRGDILRRIEELDLIQSITEPGLYVLEGILIGDAGDTLIKKSVNITIKPPRDSSFEKSVSTQPGIFKKSVTTTLKNEERLINNITLTGPIYGFEQLYSFDSPVEILIEANNKYFTYSCELNPRDTPGDSCTLSYTVNYWKLYLLLVLLTSVLFLLYVYLELPNITKKHTKHDDVHSIQVHFKNNSMKSLTSVKIKEFIPSSVMLIGTFSIKPSSHKKKENGTEIIWNIGNLDSKDERVITYSVKPRLEVDEGIVLPPAEISGINYRKKKDLVKSGTLHLK
ncbi:MAG: hypothetical protein K0B02_04115 [DPANN group archaeon]|nr:hypothetical protein [DPANN group archaeon]